MIKNFWNDIVLLNLNEFDNIGINFRFNLFLLFFALTICIAAFVYEYKRNNAYLVVKQLLRHKATSPENSKKLLDLGLDTARIRLFLSGGYIVSRVISFVGREKCSYDEYVKMNKTERKKADKIDFSTVSMYISEENMPSANKIATEYRASFIRVLIFCLLIILVYVGIAAVSSEVFNYINSSLGKS